MAAQRSGTPIVFCSTTAVVLLAAGLMGAVSGAAQIPSVEAAAGVASKTGTSRTEAIRLDHDAGVAQAASALRLEKA